MVRRVEPCWHVGGVDAGKALVIEPVSELSSPAGCQSVVKGPSGTMWVEVSNDHYWDEVI